MARVCPLSVSYTHLDVYKRQAQYPAEMGKLGVDNMLKIFDGGEAESYIDTGTKVITKDNVGEFKDYLKTFE